MKSNKITLLTMLMLVICMLVQYKVAAQQQFDWNKYNENAFKEDTVQADKSIFSQFENFGSIKSSNADIEIRYYIPQDRVLGTNVLYQMVLKGQKVERYIYFIRDNKYKLSEGTEQVGIIVNQLLLRKKVNPAKSIEDTLYQAIYNELLTGLPDQKIIVDSFKKKGVTIYDQRNNPYRRCFHCPQNFNLIELKIADKYRNFRISQQASVYNQFNPGIEIFKKYSELDRLLTIYFNDYRSALLDQRK